MIEDFNHLSREELLDIIARLQDVARELKGLIEIMQLELRKKSN